MSQREPAYVWPHKAAQDNLVTWMIYTAKLHNAPAHLITLPPYLHDDPGKENYDPRDKDVVMEAGLRRRREKSRKLAVSQLVPLAQFLGDQNRPSVSVPHWIQDELRKAIEKRRQYGGSDIDSGHCNIIRKLERVERILQPLYERKVVEPKEAGNLDQESAETINSFACLDGLQDDEDHDEDVVEEPAKKLCARVSMQPLAPASQGMKVNAPYRVNKSLTELSPQRKTWTRVQRSLRAQSPRRGTETSSTSWGSKGSPKRQRHPYMSPAKDFIRGRTDNILSMKSWR